MDIDKAGSIMIIQMDALINLDVYIQLERRITKQWNTGESGKDQIIGDWLGLLEQKGLGWYQRKT